MIAAYCYEYRTPLLSLDYVFLVLLDYCGRSLVALMPKN